MIIRPEETSDIETISTLIDIAFPTNQESQLVENLRTDNDVKISLVAIEEDKIVGHVLLSQMNAPLPALGLAPVAVRPDKQRMGIGSALINAALEVAKQQNWEVVFVLGNPKIYGKFGFNAESAIGFDCEYSGPYFMAKFLQNQPSTLKGRVSYANAFSLLK